jgi:hypothetical protein
MTAAVCAFLLALAASLSAHDPITTKVTWSREVVRIVNKSCTGCHVAGGVAPMPLSTYDEARPWAKAIKDEVVARRMPKWPAARGFGHFSNDPSLSPFEIELIAAWADGGAPKGEARDLPAQATEPVWPPPEIRLAIPARTQPPAGDQRTFDVAIPDLGKRWIAGWEFTPNDAAIVQADFSFSSGEPIGRWVPPERRVLLPGAAGQAVPSGGLIHLTITYRTSRQEQDFPIGLPTRAPQLGLIVRRTPPAFEVKHKAVRCGSEATEYTEQNVLDRPLNPPVRPSEPPVESFFAVRLTGAQAGDPVGVSLRGRQEDRALLWVRAFDPSYQPTYRLSAQESSDFLTLRVDSPNASPQCQAVLDYTVPFQK